MRILHSQEIQVALKTVASLCSKMHLVQWEHLAVKG